MKQGSGVSGRPDPRRPIVEATGHAVPGIGVLFESPSTKSRFLCKSCEKLPRGEKPFGCRVSMNGLPQGGRSLPPRTRAGSVQRMRQDPLPAATPQEDTCLRRARRGRRGVRRLEMAVIRDPDKDAGNAAGCF